MHPTLVTAALFLIYCTTAFAVDLPRVQRDVAYVEKGGAANTLDVYAPASGQNLPVMIWIHGGGWRHGDKSNVQLKPKAFNDHGFVFVSLNYPLDEKADYSRQAGDLARAVRWVHEHAKEFGGSPEQIFVMGHSAGAHLVALLATDQRYLAAEQLKLSDLQGVILLDGAGYDIPTQIRLARLPRMKEMYLSVFGNDLTKQQDASPLSHVAQGKHIPPFLILYVSERRDSRLQSNALAERLVSAGTSAKAIPAANKTHATINREIGAPDDAPTTAVFDFLKQRLETIKN